jgi:hypothetical protein
MRADYFKPGTIPNYDDLETLAYRSSTELRCGLMSDIRHNGIYEDMVRDPDFAELLQSYAARITAEYIDANDVYDADTQEQLGTSVYLSLFMGVAISRRLQGPADWGMYLDNVAAAMQEGIFYDYMTQATKRYISPRPVLNTVVGEGLRLMLDQRHDIDKDAHALPLGKMAAQLTLMHTEEFFLARHVEAMAKPSNFSTFEDQFKG